MMGNKFIAVALAIVIGVVVIPIVISALGDTRAPSTTVCATQANTTFATFTITGTHYVYEWKGKFYCSTSATAPTSDPTDGATISEIVASALPLADFPGAESLVVIIPLGLVAGILWYAMKTMQGGKG